MEVKLENSIVILKDKLGWGDIEHLKSKALSGAKIKASADNLAKAEAEFDSDSILELKYITLECIIVEIKKDGVVSQFTRDWMNALSNDDGNKLYDAVEKVAKKK